MPPRGTKTNLVYRSTHQPHKSHNELVRTCKRHRLEPYPEGVQYNITNDVSRLDLPILRLVVPEVRVWIYKYSYTFG
eukprot:SAG31_NODE_9_length_42330_cov_441.979162_7_plen_77_part_00